MKREFRLLDKDMLSEQHFPIKAIFDMLSDDRFIRVLEGISKGRGFGENYGACVFPDEKALVENSIQIYKKKFTD